MIKKRFRLKKNILIILMWNKLPLEKEIMINTLNWKLDINLE